MLPWSAPEKISRSDTATVRLRNSAIANGRDSRCRGIQGRRPDGRVTARAIAPALQVQTGSSSGGAKVGGGRPCAAGAPGRCASRAARRPTESSGNPPASVARPGDRGGGRRCAASKVQVPGGPSLHRDCAPISQVANLADQVVGNARYGGRCRAARLAKVQPQSAGAHLNLGAYRASWYSFRCFNRVSAEVDRVQNASRAK